MSMTAVLCIIFPFVLICYTPSHYRVEVSQATSHPALPDRRIFSQNRLLSGLIIFTI
jgi:hypothetical protein